MQGSRVPSFPVPNTAQSAFHEQPMQGSQFHGFPAQNPAYSVSPNPPWVPEYEGHMTNTGHAVNPGAQAWSSNGVAQSSGMPNSMPNPSMIHMSPATMQSPSDPPAVHLGSLEELNHDRWLAFMPKAHPSMPPHVAPPQFQVSPQHFPPGLCGSSAGAQSQEAVGNAERWRAFMPGSAPALGPSMQEP